jgi:streptomycin 6-kinase
MDGMTLLGQGREAEVFARPDGSVLKLLRQAGQSADREIAALASVADGDALVPRVLGRMELDDRPGILLERVDGPDLLSLVGSRPWLLRRAGRVMAQVHARLHAVPGPTGLPDLRTELANRIRSVTRLPADLASWVLSILDKLPDGDRLCHGDFHLGNILGGLDHPVVIDGGEAARSDPVADVANTWLVHRMANRRDPDLSRPSALNIGEAFRYPAVAYPDQVDPAHVAVGPGVPPSQQRAVASGDELLDIEVRGGRVGEEAPERVEHGVASDVSGAIWGCGVLEEAVVGDAVGEGVDVMRVECVVESLDRGPCLVVHGHRVS